jgi:hypothetical protein
VLPARNHQQSLCLLGKDERHCHLPGRLLRRHNGKSGCPAQLEGLSCLSKPVDDADAIEDEVGENTVLDAMVSLVAAFGNFRR